MTSVNDEVINYDFWHVSDAGPKRDGIARL